MPTTIYYEFRFSYIDEDSRRFPGLLIELYRPGTPEYRVTVVAHLDTGAECSLFQGELTTAIGLDLLEGRPFAFNFTSGDRLEARRHDVIIEHSELGAFPLVVAFSMGNIKRNILGRDFFTRVQIGFWERLNEFYVTRVIG